MMGAQQVWTLRALSVEIDEFEEQNAKLEETQQRLETEVNTLGERKEKLGNQVGKLQGTCEELKDFSEKLTNEISGFESLKGKKLVLFKIYLNKNRKFGEICSRDWSRCKKSIRRSSEFRKEDEDHDDTE